MMKLSVAIATYNEEENLGRCLDSVSGWVDEIVVVDGGSKDKTVQIAKNYGARVINTDNPQIFHINKQKAIDACKSKWILQLDADEVVSESLKYEIVKTIEKSGESKESRLKNQDNNGNQSLIMNHEPLINGYWIPRKNLFLGKWLMKGGQYPDYTLRLYRNGKGRLPCKTVHEQAVVEGKTGYLKNALLHYPYSDFSEYLNKSNTYTSLTARFLRDEELKINTISTLKYFIQKPISTFFNLYFRHQGFLDGFAGFVWALFSALHYPTAYIKYWEKSKGKNKN